MRAGRSPNLRTSMLELYEKILGMSLAMTLIDVHLDSSAVGTLLTCDERHFGVVEGLCKAAQAWRLVQHLCPRCETMRMNDQVDIEAQGCADP